MGVMHKYGLITCLIPAMLALAACNQKAETGGGSAKPQAALAVPGSGGRNAAPDAAASPAAPAQTATPAAVRASILATMPASSPATGNAMTSDSAAKA
jgi:hypothetical protein